MIIKTPEGRTNETEELFASVKEEVMSLRKEVKKLIKKLKAGEEINEKDASGHVTRLRDTVGLCHKLENQIVLCRQTLGPCGYAIDFAEARAEIGSRLDRLARHCDA